MIKNDLISREAAIDSVYKCTDIFVNNLPVMVDKADAYKALAQLPPAEPERKRGEWVGSHVYCEHLNEEAKLNGKTERYLPSGMVIGVYCGQCWCRADKRSNFCPNCGADMKGEQDDN